MTAAQTDEWTIIEGLLPNGWEDAAREQQAFRRVRYTSSPGALLRLLLFHAVNGSGLRETVVHAKATRRMRRKSQRKQQQLDNRSLEAAHFILVFTTLSRDALDAVGVLELYRGRWQIERVLKRLKQLLTLGHVPHQHPAVARSWISAKLVASLLLETLYRNARCFFPLGLRHLLIRAHPRLTAPAVGRGRSSRLV